VDPSRYPDHGRHPADSHDAALQFLDDCHAARHRGQLYLMLGLLGVTKPPIHGLTGEEVQAGSRPGGGPG